MCSTRVDVARGSCFVFLPCISPCVTITSFSFFSSPLDLRIDSTSAVLSLQWIRSPKPLLLKTAFNKSPLRPRPHESGVKNIRIRVEGTSILFAVGAVNASRQGQQNNSNVQKRCKKIVVKSLNSVKKSLFFLFLCFPESELSPQIRGVNNWRKRQFNFVNLWIINVLYFYNTGDIFSRYYFFLRNASVVLFSLKICKSE